MIKIVTNVQKNKKFLQLFTLAAMSFNLYSSPTGYTPTFTTNVVYPNVTNGTIFKPVNNQAHRILFYTGTKDGQVSPGYYLAQNFLGWVQYKFPVLEQYNVLDKNILDVSNGPRNKTVVLSYVNGVGQLLSNTSDGKAFATQRINTESKFNHLTLVDVGGLQSVAVYGNTHTSLLTSSDANSWQQWALPNICSTNTSCVFDNKFFGSLNDKFVLLQSKNQNSVISNEFYTSTNLVRWYGKDLPFANDLIQNVTGDNNVLVASVKQGLEHKLWLTPDLTNWVDYTLPSDAEVTDSKTFSQNKLAVLLVRQAAAPTTSAHLATCIASDGDCPPCPCQEHHKGDAPVEPTFVTDVLVIDSANQSQEVLHTFAGRLTSITNLDNKLFFAGDFTNDNDKKHAALASTSF